MDRFDEHEQIDVQRKAEAEMRRAQRRTRFIMRLAMLLAPFALWGAVEAVAWAASGLRGAFWLIGTQQASAPTGTSITGVDRVWVKSSNDHLIFTSTSNVDTDLLSGAGGVTSGTLFWSPADVIRTQYSGTALQAGNFTVGMNFTLTLNGTVSGVRFWYPGPTSHTVKASVWDASHTRQGSCTVAVSTAGIYSCTFTPVSVTAGQQWYVSYWDNSATHYWVATLTDTLTPGAYTTGRASLIAGPNIMLNVFLYQAGAGDVWPNSTAGGFMAAVEPVFTVP